VATRPASAATGSFCTSSVASWLLCTKLKATQSVSSQSRLHDVMYH
jgi:hypothetical protein